jgi:excisionase family DNA binding protein
MNIENIISFEELPLSLNVKELAMVLRISLNKAYELCHSKEFPCYRIGKRRLIIPKAALKKWMENPNNLKEIA